MFLFVFNTFTTTLKSQGSALVKLIVANFQEGVGRLPPALDIVQFFHISRGGVAHVAYVDYCSWMKYRQRQANRIRCTFVSYTALAPADSSVMPRYRRYITKYT